MEKRIRVKLLRVCKGFAYEPGAEVDIDEERAAPFIDRGYMVAMGASIPRNVIPEKPEPEDKQVKRGRPKRNG